MMGFFKIGSPHLYFLSSYGYRYDPSVQSTFIFEAEGFKLRGNRKQSSPKVPVSSQTYNCKEFTEDSTTAKILQLKSNLQLQRTVLG
jgi:hypothetical protein